MKSLLFITMFFALSQTAFAQTKTVTALRNQLNQQVDSLNNNFLLDENHSAWLAQLEKDFYIDTFYAEHLWQIEMEEDMSTMGMVSATQNAEANYDKLLNKYYKKLLTILNTADKDKLKASQRNWVKFRDAEKELNYTLYKEEYSGGGTIHKIFVAHKNLNITKTRVSELYNLLNRIWK